MNALKRTLTRYEQRRNEIVKRFRVTQNEAGLLLSMDCDDCPIALSNGKEAHTRALPLTNDDPQEYYVPVYIGTEVVCVNYKYHD